MGMGKLSRVSQRVLVKYPPLFPVVRLGLLLFAIFSQKKKKETVRSAAQKIREGKGCSAKAGACRERKGEGRATAPRL